MCRRPPPHRTSCPAQGRTPLSARRTFKPCHCEPVRTLVWQSVPPLRRTPVIWKNGFPRRFAPRNDIFIIPPSVGVGVLDDPHAQPPCHAIGAGSYPARSAAPSLIPCRAAPMCAAARPRIAPLALRRGGLPCPPAALSNPVIASQCAHWCGNPYPPRISCIFLRRAGCPHPVADKHSTPQTLSLRGA